MDASIDVRVFCVLHVLLVLLLQKLLPEVEVVLLA
jgi:hypothetical protein